MELQTNTLAIRQRKEVQLHDLVNEFLLMNSPKLIANGRAVINEIQPDIFVHTEISGVKNLFDRLLQLLLLQQKNTQVSITAKTCRDTVSIHFEEHNLYDCSEVFAGIMELVPEAVRLGGYLGMRFQPNGRMTTVLTILNNRNPESMDIAERLAALVSAKREIYGQAEQSAGRV